MGNSLESRLQQKTPVRESRFRAPAMVLALLCAMYAIFYMDRSNIATAAPLMKADLHLSNTQMGLVFSAFAVPFALFQLIGGLVGDRFGPRLILTLASAIVGLATVLTGLSGGLVSLVIVRMAIGLGEGAANATATRAMSIWVPSQKWGFAQGITHSFAHIGTALTPPLMVALFALASWRGSFVVSGGAALVWLVIWVWYFRDDPKEHKGISEGDLRLLAKASASVRPKVPWLRLARTIYPLTVVDFCYGWTLWLFLTWIPTFFLENYHLKLTDSAFFTSGVLLAGVVGDTAGGLVTDRIYRVTGNLVRARRSVIVTGFLGGFVFMLPVVLVHDLKTSAVCLSLAFFCAELIVAPIWSVPMDIAPRFSGTASGMMNFGFAVAGLVSPSSFGYLVDLTGSWVVPFIGSIVLLFAGAVLAWRLRPDRTFVADGV